MSHLGPHLLVRLATFSIADPLMFEQQDKDGSPVASIGKNIDGQHAGPSIGCRVESNFVSELSELSAFSTSFPKA